MISRTIITKIQKQFFRGKAIIVLGARQVGKSTLLKNLLHGEEDVLWLDAENPDVNLIFENATATRLRTLIGKNRFLVIDEAQKVNAIGSKLKLITDYIPEVQVIATGSSSFELRNKLNEPLTGRKYEHKLFPVSFSEMTVHNSLLEEKRMLSHRLVYGYYPEIVTHEEDAETLLTALADSYLYKDLLLLSEIRKPEKINDLLKALAWQIGNEVSFNELGKLIGLRSETVEQYVHLLEQLFIVYRLNSYHRNHRKEIKKGKKIFFTDLGIRNAVINDFTPFEIRQDKGGLFENFIINELIKEDSYAGKHQNFYFWRTTDQREIDLILEKNNFLTTFEIKWNSGYKPKISRSFTDKYAAYNFSFIHSENFYEFLI